MGVVRKDVVKLSIPIFIEQAFVMLMGTINTLMASNIGKEAVSAIGMVDSINNIFIAVFGAVAIGGTVIVAQYAGQRNMEAASETTKQTLFGGLLLSIIITLLLWSFRYPVINFLYGSADKAVIENSIIYMAITLISFPLIALSSIGTGVLRGAGDTKTPMKVTIVMNIINMILSYIMIYGLYIGNPHLQIEIPALGLKGAAIGITTARAIGALMIMYPLMKGTKVLKLSKLYLFRPNLEMQKSIFGIAIPSSVESILFTGGKLVTQIFIVSMGTAATAANSIAGSVAGLINIPGSALSIAATTLVGQNMGRGEPDQGKNDLFYVTKSSSFCLLIGCIFTFMFSEGIASLYTQNEEILHLTAVLIKCISVATPIFWSLSFVLPAGLKGAGDARFVMIASIIGMWAFRVTMGYILGIVFGLGVAGIWIGMFIDWIVRGVLYFVRLKNGKWKKNVVV